MQAAAWRSVCVQLAAPNDGVWFDRRCLALVQDERVQVSIWARDDNYDEAWLPMLRVWALKLMHRASNLLADIN